MITLLDGSMGQELLARSKDAPTALWSTKVMKDHPHLVRDIHLDYFRAGAIIATTNTYAIHRDRLRPHDAEGEFRALHEQALSLASAAREAHGSGYIAGAMGPLGATYRPDLAPPEDQAADYYAEIAQIQAEHVDFFLLETMSSIAQARGAIMGALVPGKPVWLAVSVDDKDGTRLRSGEPISELASAIAEFDVAAVLINCSPPEVITGGILKLGSDWPIGAYANGFTEISEAFAVPGQVVTDLETRHDIGPSEYADFALRWADDGATILGGCCEIGPAHIARLRDAIDAEGLGLATEILS